MNIKDAKVGQRVKFPKTKSVGNFSLSHALKDFENNDIKELYICKIREAGNMFSPATASIGHNSKLQYSFAMDEIELWEEEQVPVYKGVYVSSGITELLTAFKKQAPKGLKGDHLSLSSIYYFGDTEPLMGECKWFNLQKNYSEALKYVQEFAASHKPKEHTYDLKGRNLILRENEIELGGEKMRYYDLTNWYNSTFIAQPKKVFSFIVQSTKVKIGCTEFTAEELLKVFEKHEELFPNAK